VQREQIKLVNKDGSANCLGPLHGRFSPELYSASWCRRMWVASYRLSSSDHFGPKQLFIER
jgi:hypothetical protein